MCSCAHTSKLVFKSRTDFGKLRFYANSGEGAPEFYARVDSNNVVIFYTYRIDDIHKTYRNSKNYVFTLVSGSNLMAVIPYSLTDSIVFATGDRLLDSLNLGNLKHAKGSTGFVIEIAGH